MADNNFRSYRGRDAGAPPRSQPDDPLAELARLIGQSEPATDYDRDARGGPSFDQPARDLDWAAEDRYAQQREPAEADYDAPRRALRAGAARGPAPDLSSWRTVL